MYRSAPKAQFLLDVFTNLILLFKFNLIIIIILLLQV